MYNPVQLRHRARVFQYHFRLAHALHPTATCYQAARALETKGRPDPHLLHGHLHHRGRYTDQVVQPDQRLGPVIHALVHTRILGCRLRFEHTHDLAPAARVLPLAQVFDAWPEDHHVSTGQDLGHWHRTVCKDDPPFFGRDHGEPRHNDDPGHAKKR